MSEIITKPPLASEAGHWYAKDGTPCYEVPYADPAKGMRPTTLRDARKLNLLPSVTTVLRVLHKQALVEWLIKTACEAVLTAPRLPGEELDAFVERVLKTERQQDQESQIARDLGTEVHADIERILKGDGMNPKLSQFTAPVIAEVNSLGWVMDTEKVVIGNGYAGKTDAVVEGESIYLLDFKTTKKLPKESYSEHQLQTAAYARALGNTGDKPIVTGNIYISTTEPGKVVVSTQKDWLETFANGFRPLLEYWQWANDYRP